MKRNLLKNKKTLLKILRKKLKENIVQLNQDEPPKFEKSKSINRVNIDKEKVDQNPESNSLNSNLAKTNENSASAKNENSNPANTKAKTTFFSFKKPSTDSRYNALLEKLKSKKKIRPSSKKQQLLEEAAVKNKNTMLNYVLPLTPSADKSKQQDGKYHKVEKEAESLKA